MKLIDKDKIREWLEAKKKREGWCAVGADVADVYYARGVRFTCDTCKDFLDTLELKEVNFERELSKYVSNGIHRFFPNVDDDYCKIDSVIWQDYVIETAKHFYELGLKVYMKKFSIDS